MTARPPAHEDDRANAAADPVRERASRSYYPDGSAWRRALGSLRHESPRTFAFKLLAELGYRRVVLLARDLDDPIPDGPPADGTAFERLGKDRLDEYVAFRSSGDRARIAKQFDAGYECYVLRRDGRVVSSCWATSEPQWSAYLGCTIPTGPGDVYLTDAWTHPDFRGHAYAHVLCLHQLRHFRDRGFRRAVRSTIPENYSALRVHAKSGFRPLALIGTMRVGPWRRTFRRAWRRELP